jgi:hypothetical protein
VVHDGYKECVTFIAKGMPVQDEGGKFLRNVRKYLIQRSSVTSYGTGMLDDIAVITSKLAKYKLPLLLCHNGR